MAENDLRYQLYLREMQKREEEQRRRDVASNVYMQMLYTYKRRIRALFATQETATAHDIIVAANDARDGVDVPRLAPGSPVFEDLMHELSTCPRNGLYKVYKLYADERERAEFF